MARKVFLSILGTGYYNRTKYYWNKQSNYIETRFVQEATLKLLAKDWGKNDHVYFFLTEEAENTNWRNPAQQNHSLVKIGERDTYTGLSEILKKSDLLFVYSVKKIPNGNNEKEIWEIFETVFNVLQDNDEVYFDITHAFRSIPMLVMVLVNYAKFLRNINVGRITYGNWEGRDKETNLAPIIELTAFSELQDWTSAANEFLSFGYSKNLGKLFLEKINILPKEEKNKIKNFEKILNETTNLFTTIRGNNIIEGDEFTKLRKTLQTLENNSEIPSLNPVLSKIKKKIQSFKDNDLINGFIAIEWCIEHKLVQQAITLTQEMVITYLCYIFKGKYNLDYKSKEHREAMSSLFGVVNNNIPEEGWKGSLKKNIEVYKQIKDEELFIKLIKVFNKLTEIRNSINHAGFVGALKASTIENNFVKYFEEIKQIIEY